LSDDPYATTPDLSPNTDTYCGVLVDPQGLDYRLETYDSEADAHAAGAQITHRGTCGQCSSLQNLAVYMANPDLTEPVRDCGLEGIISGEKANIDCLMEIGFDLPCAQIWYYNTKHTRDVCLTECLAKLKAPHHQPDGSLNACLQCDEDHSGDVFKAIAGRTRRNSGLPSALCRPCESVYPVVHDYN